MVRVPTLLALTVVASVACDDSTGPENTGLVEIAFATGTATASEGAAPPAAARGVPVEGSNGTLDITRVHLIVDELELEGAHEGCVELDDDGEEELDDCEEFEAELFLFELPLTEGETVTVVAESVPAGLYTGFEFEVDDVDLDEDDDDEELSALLADVTALHSDWPAEASMVVVGTFTPSGEAPRSFRVFAEAKVEIEMAFDEPLAVGPDQRASITIFLDPAAWFTRPDGTVLDLSAFDFTGDEEDILELEAEFKDGVTKIEVEIDDD